MATTFPNELSLVLGATVLATALSVAATAGETSNETEPVTVYTGPRPAAFVLPEYPRSALHTDSEGWVHLNFMVDTAGKPYEIVVSDSLGHPDLKAAAIRALERTPYVPAKLGDVPLDAGATRKYAFVLTGGKPSVTRTAYRAYRGLVRFARRDDKERADEVMASLAKYRARNLHENAWLNLAKFAYYGKWGTPAQQLRALNRAVAYESEAKYLPPELFALAQLERFRLLVRTRDYGTAMLAFNTLKQLDIDDQRREKLEAVARQLEALRENDSAYSVPGEVQADAHWLFHLFKDDFALRDVQGEIAELKLYCQRKFVFFRFDPSLEYRVHDGGRCELRVVGNPGTTFQLVQW